MADRHESGQAATASDYHGGPQAGWAFPAPAAPHAYGQERPLIGADERLGHGMQTRPPSGLFPGLPHRPVYREPHPVRSGPLFIGLASTVLWFALFGMIAHDLASYAWWTIVAAISAWAVALVLSLLGDRGVAVGIALASGFGLAIALGFVTNRWITTENWPLW